MGIESKPPALTAAIVFILLFSSVSCMCCYDAGGYSGIGEEFYYENLYYKVTKEKTGSEPGEVELIGPRQGAIMEGELNIPKIVENKDAEYVVKYIAVGAFGGCSGLTGPLTIPDSVTSIGGAAFFECSGLTGPLTILGSVTYIGDTAFDGCSGLTGPLTIPSTVAYIGAYAFFGCSGFDALAIGKEVKGIDKDAFYGWSFTDSSGDSTDVGPGKVFKKNDGKMVEQDGVWMITRCFNVKTSYVDYMFVEKGAIIDEDELPTPSRAGFIFKGWEKEGVSIIVPHYVFDSEVLNAVWEKEKSIKMSFVDGNGTELLNPMFFSLGDTFKLPGAVKNGYTFVKWTDKYGNDWMYLQQYTVEGDMTFTAVWDPEYYTISFDTQGGSAVASITLPFGTTIVKPADPTKSGYTFDGWDKTVPQTMPAENMKITASWSINQYMMTFDTDGGSEVPSIKGDYGMTISKPGNPTKDGYKFVTWDRPIPDKMPAENMTIKAVWAKEVADQSILLFVDSNGTSLFNPVSINNGETYTLPAAVKEGYKFEGWMDSDGNLWKYLGGYEVKGDMTFTAQWTKAPQPGQTDGGISPAVTVVIGAACIMAGIVGTFFVMRYRW